MTTLQLQQLYYEFHVATRSTIRVSAIDRLAISDINFLYLSLDFLQDWDALLSIYGSTSSGNGESIYHGIPRINRV